MVESKGFVDFKLSDDVFILLINVKMPTIVGILTSMSRINFILSCWAWKKFYNLRARESKYKVLTQASVIKDRLSNFQWNEKETFTTCTTWI